MPTPNENFTSSFSVQAVSGSIYAFLRMPSDDFAKLKRFGGSVGVGITEVGFEITSSIIANFTSALSSAAAAGTGSYSYG